MGLLLLLLQILKARTGAVLVIDLLWSDGYFWRLLAMDTEGPGMYPEAALVPYLTIVLGTMHYTNS